MKYIYGNFKMNSTVSDVKAYLMTLVTNTRDEKNEVAVALPYTHLTTAKEYLVGSNVKLGSQNVAEEEKGAFTGEISADMLKDVGVDFTLIGHSERRNIYNESDKSVNKKIKMALAKGVEVVLCIGESLKTKEAGKVESFLKKQLEEDLKGLYENELKSIIIAYEPIWAIGTGKSATTKEIEKTIAIVRDIVAHIYSEKAGKEIVVLYGGSVNPDNFKSILNTKGVDGALIGGACLDADKFSSMIKSL